MRLTPDRSTVTSLAGLVAVISNHACAASSTQNPASSPFSLSVATAVMVSMLESLRFTVCGLPECVCPLNPQGPSTRSLEFPPVKGWLSEFHSHSEALLLPPNRGKLLNHTSVCDHCLFKIGHN